MTNYDELRRAQDDVRAYRSALLKLNRENATLRAAAKEMLKRFPGHEHFWEGCPQCESRTAMLKALGDAS